MSIYVVGSSKNMFLENDSIREKFIVDEPHQGINIDNLNPWYCELTALYYMWKNSKAGIVGLEHYRRFFASPKKNKTRLTKEEAEEILKDNEIITCTFRHKPGYSAFKWFSDSGKGTDLDTFIEILDDSQPGLGKNFYLYLNERELVQCNMFIARKPLIDAYCEWLFPLLSKYDKYVGLGNDNKRIDGYFGEHIFGLWLRLNKVKQYTCTKVEVHYLVRSGFPA